MFLMITNGPTSLKNPSGATQFRRHNPAWQRSSLRIGSVSSFTLTLNGVELASHILVPERPEAPAAPGRVASPPAPESPALPPAAPVSRPSGASFPASPDYTSPKTDPNAYHPPPSSIRPRGGIYTYTSRYVSPLDLRASDIAIGDIAHALALCNRFAGHTLFPLSVAQHCVYVSRLASNGDYLWDPGRSLARAGLLHDASEAYLGDVTKWLKAEPEMAGYREAEHRIQKLVDTKYRCDSSDYRVVAADKLMVRYEAWRMWGPTMPLFQRPDYPVPTVEERALVGEWEPWPWQKAEVEFLRQFQRVDLVDLYSE